MSISFFKGKNTGEKKVVLVVGGGISGASVISNLINKSKNLELILVESREAAIWKPAGTRSAVLGEEFAHKACVPVSNLIPEGQGRVYQAEVVGVSLSENSITLSTGNRLNYDYLVIATGARNLSPCDVPKSIKTLDNMKAHYQQMSELISISKSILVLGGGAVAVEFSGEIKQAHPEKDVFIVSPQQKLLAGCRPEPPNKFFDKLEAKIRKRGIITHLDQFAANLTLEDFNGHTFLSGKRTVKLSAGAELSVDLIFLCIGRELNNSSFPDVWKDQNGAVKVKPTLQLTTRENVFAVGDINDVNENKQGYLAEKQAKVVADNILLLSKNKVKLKRYEPGKKTEILVPVGKSDGVSLAAGRLWGAEFTKRVKGNDLFVSRIFSIYKQKKFLKVTNKEIKKDMKLKNKKSVVNEGPNQMGNFIINSQSDDRTPQLSASKLNALEEEKQKEEENQTEEEKQNEEEAFDRAKGSSHFGIDLSKPPPGMEPILVEPISSFEGEIVSVETPQKPKKKKKKKKKDKKTQKKSPSKKSGGKGTDTGNETFPLRDSEL
eukprot:augustus_masked-scaffold_15-processed-gene-10.54-mRNA-1 protein AED:1.00 eAED:1.00 QI:0/-1/0/0/-1/1/1/0/548